MKIKSLALGVAGALALGLQPSLNGALMAMSELFIGKHRQS